MPTRNGEDSIRVLRQSVDSDFDKYSFNSRGPEWHQK